MFDDVAGDFLRQREWETHNILTDRGELRWNFIWPDRRIGLRRIGPEQARQQETSRGNALAAGNAAAPGATQRQCDNHCQTMKFPI
jgi:hypothetical protein